MDTKPLKPKGIFFFSAETTFFSLCLIAFLAMHFFFDIDDKSANLIYIVFIALSFGWMYGCKIIFKKADIIHFKMLKKNYLPAENPAKKADYHRKGLAGVIILWIIYLGFIFALKLKEILTWELFLAGASFMFILNSFFSRKICLLSTLFLHNKNNCCKNCGINCWDYAIFASPLAFAPKLSLVASILNYVIIFISFFILVLWEYNYRKHPYRFYPETNANLTCKNCAKKCNGTRAGQKKKELINN